MTVRATCYGQISKGAVTVCLDCISGFSPLLLADLAIPGVELGEVKKNITENTIPTNPLRRMQMKQPWMKFLFAKAVFLPTPMEIPVMLDPVSHLLLSVLFSYECDVL